MIYFPAMGVENDTTSGIVDGDRRLEHISNSAMLNLIAAVGNHEAKALLLASMQPGIPYSEGDLRRLMVHNQGEQEVWRMHPNTLFGYCQNSFEGVGLVARPVYDETATEIAYIKTPYGERTGTSFAGQMLALSERLSVDHPNISLDKVFGGTTSRGRTEIMQDGAQQLTVRKRSVQTRLKIYEELLSNPSLPISLAQLKEAIGEIGVTHEAIMELRNAGIVSYESSPDTAPRSAYAAAEITPNTPLIPHHHAKSLTYEILEFLQADPSRIWSVKELIHSVNSKRERKLNTRSLSNNISSVIRLLIDQKYVVQKESPQNSKISIADDQKGILEDVINTLYRFQNGAPQFTHDGTQLAAEITSDPQRFAVLLLRAKEGSHHANSPQFADEILRIITAHNEPLSARQIQDALLRSGMQISKSVVNAHLNTLRTRGSIKIDHTNRSAFWTIK